MIGIDLTFINSNEIELGEMTGSIEVFTADLLDCISNLHYEKNFILIIHPAARTMIKRRFRNYKIYAIGGLGLYAYYKVTRRQGIQNLKKIGIFNKLIKIKGIKMVWFPWMIPENIIDYNINYIGTCHDLMMVTNEDTSDKYREMFCNAMKIVTVSDYVKNQIIKKYNVKNKKLVTIHNSIYATINKMQCEPIEILDSKEFIFDCNAFAERKNTLTMIRAFERIMNDIQYDLVLCGGYKHDDYYDKICNYIENNNLSERIHIFLGIDEKQKNWLFQNCVLFVTPSENEGFGRTPIEASLCLKPVISSRCTALEEATCGLVHYINNPRDDEELANAIILVLNNPDSMLKLEEIRETYIKKYSPDTIVDKYIKMFNELS